MEAPAWLYLVGAPPGAEISGLDADGGIALVDEVVIGRAADCDIVVRAPMIGGRRNSSVSIQNGRWRYQHLGHGIPTFHNESLIPPHSPLTKPLSHGDVIGPLAAGDDARITFLFLAQSGLPRSAVLPPVEQALHAAYPDRAAQLVSHIRRWFASEPLASFDALDRVLACDLCGRFARDHGLVEIDRPGPSFQVLADWQGSIGSPTYESIELCETCLASPGATLSCAENVDRLRVDLDRALPAAGVEREVVTELHRRREAAQPVIASGTCVLCRKRERALVGGGRRPICAECLRGASAIRHIRG